MVCIQTLAAATPGKAQFTDVASAPAHPIMPPTLGVAGDASASIAAVYTASEFQSAINTGVRDIEIHAHLDLQDIFSLPTTVVDNYDVNFIGIAAPSTRSVRVCPNC